MTTATCPRHLDEKATKTCARCSTAYCYLCTRTVGSETICLPCRLHEPAAKGPPVVSLLVVLALGVATLGVWIIRQRAAGPEGEDGSATAPPDHGAAPASASVAGPGSGAEPSPPPANPYTQGGPSTGPQKLNDQDAGVAFAVPEGHTLGPVAKEGPRRAYTLMRDGKPVLQVVIMTAYPWMRPEELMGGRTWVEGNRPQIQELMFERSYEGVTHWSLRASPAELALRSPERYVYIRSPQAWAAGGPEAALLSSFEWLPLPPLLESSWGRSGQPAEEAGKPLTPEERAVLDKAVASTKKLGSLPSSIHFAVQYAERTDLTRAQGWLVREFLADVLQALSAAAESHPR